MSDGSAVESVEREGVSDVLPLTKRCEREQAVLFADILRKELRHMRRLRLRRRRVGRGVTTAMSTLNRRNAWNACEVGFRRRARC